LRPLVVIGSAALLLAGCRASKLSLPADGMVAGHRLHTTVDSEIARYYIEEYLQGVGRDSPSGRVVRKLETNLATGSLDSAQFQQIGRNYSADFAALLFAQTLLERPSNRRAQGVYLESLETLRQGQRLESLAGQTRSYEILFAPGWLYRRHPETGADFRMQRALLGELGIRNSLIETDENASVEANADAIAAAIRSRSDSGRDLILVSTSKSGPEAALALVQRLRPEELIGVRAWINIGGVLQGSALADAALRVPRRWLAGLVLRGKCDGLVSLTTKSRRPIFEVLRIPARILVLNYVGVPLSGSVTAQARDGYEDLRRLGPNDGLTLLADEIMPGGVTIIEPGLDHFFAAPGIRERTLALLATVLSEIRSNRGASS